MKKINILFFALVCSFSVSAQIPQIQWQKCLGGTYSDWGYSVIQTFDGGYVVAGYSNSIDGDVTGNHGDEDYWVVKLNSSGAIQWEKSLGGTGDERATSIIQTLDSGYIVAGYSESNDGDVSGNHGDRDYWVVKLNQSGSILWQKSLGGTDEDKANSVTPTTDSGCIVAGYTYSWSGDVTSNHGGNDYWLVKLNASGNIQWQKCIGGSIYDEATSIIQTFDNGYMVAGLSWSNDGDVTGNHGNYDYWVAKLSASGVIEWQKSLGGTNQDFAYSVFQSADSGYVVAGNSQSNDGDVTGNHGDWDFWVVKLDATGNMLWQKSLGGTIYDEAYSAIQSSDGGYIIAGGSYSNDGDVNGNHGGWDYWLVELDTSGNIQWQKCIGGTAYESATSIIQFSDSGFALAGTTYSNDGDVTGNHGNVDYWIVKLGVATGIENLFTSNALHVYPNPSTHNFSIPANSEFNNAQLNIFNAMGCNVYSSRLTREAKAIDAENFSSGIYYLQVIKGEKMWGEKIIKL